MLYFVHDVALWYSNIHRQLNQFVSFLRMFKTAENPVECLVLTVFKINSLIFILECEVGIK